MHLSDPEREFNIGPYGDCQTKLHLIITWRIFIIDTQSLLQTDRKSYMTFHLNMYLMTFDDLERSNQDPTDVRF